MTLYIVQRILMLIPVWLGVTLLAFGLGRLAPGDPAQLVANQRSDGRAPDELVESVRTELGLDQPLVVQYGRWLAAAVQGDLGVSFRSGGPVLEELVRRFPATLQLAVWSLIVGVALSLPLGILSAMHRASLIDHISRMMALVGASLPGFWLAFLLIILFSVKLHWLPVSGRSEWRHLVLPSVVLGLSVAAPLMRLMRSSLLEVLEEDYVRTARAKGLSRRGVVLGHAMRNALIPVITVASLRFGFLLGGAVIIEVVFAWPGVGKLVVDGIFARDYPLIQGYVLFMGTVFIVINLLIDLLYVVIDPRVRLTGESGGAHGTA